MAMKLSPAIYRNKHADRPMEASSVRGPIVKLENSFVGSLTVHLIGEHTRDFYDNETNEIDSEAHQIVKESSQRTTERLMSKIELILEKEWKAADDEVRQKIAEMKKNRYDAGSAKKD